MSDGRVRAAIEHMEAWLADPTWEPNADTLDEWHLEFMAAAGQAEKAAGWAELVARAHAAGRMLEMRSRVLAEERDRIKAAMAAQDRGSRALKGYGATSR
jgi:hypothetical protein